MAGKRKSKRLTTLLALFLGGFGIHRFYLGQPGRGIIYFLLSFIVIGFILGFIDFLIFLFMDQETFERNYNHYREYRDFDRDAYRRYRRNRYARQAEQREPGLRRHRVQRIPVQRVNPNNTRLKALIQSGKSHYDNFDFFEAIAQWEKALEMSPTNIAVHYNLACAYSLTEQADEGFHHLSQAVKHGFKDFKKLKQQDALAFLRIQPEFDEFEKNKYQIKKELEKQEEEINQPHDSSILEKPDLLQQLKELGDLRDRGILTEEEFLAEKKKLL